MVEVPDSMTSIGTGAFTLCMNLTTINLTAGISYIGEPPTFDIGVITIIAPEGSYAYQYAESIKPVTDTEEEDLTE